MLNFTVPSWTIRFSSTSHLIWVGVSGEERKSVVDVRIRRRLLDERVLKFAQSLGHNDVFEGVSNRRDTPFRRMGRRKGYTMMEDEDVDGDGDGDGDYYKE